MTCEKLGESWLVWTGCMEGNSSITDEKKCLVELQNLKIVVYYQKILHEKEDFLNM